MEKYERTIGLKTILLTLVRRFLIILCIFLPIALVSVVYTKAIMKTEYTTTIVLTRASSFTPTNYPTMYSAIKSMKNAEAVAQELAKTTEGEGEEAHAITPTKHADGSDITADEIYAGITMAASISTSLGSINVSFKTKDSTIAQIVLKTVIEFAQPDYKAVTDVKYGEASTPTDNSSTKNKYLLIGVAAGLVLALGFAFVYEIVSDEVYDKADIENLGCAGFELTVTK